MNKPKFHRKYLYSLHWRNLPAASGNLFLSFLFYSASHGDYLLGTSFRHLGLVMQIEFLAIHSFPFLVFIAIAKPDSLKKRMGQLFLFFGLLAIYFMFAWIGGKWIGIFMFIGLSVITYLGLLFKIQSEERYKELGVRWIICLFIFLLTSGIADMPSDVGSWNSSTAVLKFGQIYFLILGLIEIIGFYQSFFVAAPDREIPGSTF